MTLPSLIYHKSINIGHRHNFSLDQTIPKPGDKVIVFVHGRGGHPADFTLMIKAYQGRGHSLKTIHLNNNHYSPIDDDTLILRDELSKYPNCSISLVGHSKGGLVAINYHQLFPDDRRINKIITISSPLHGTKIAEWLFWAPVIGQIFKYTDQVTYNHNRVPIYHVVPQWDHLIIPTSSCLLATTPRRNIFYYNGYYSHLGIVYDQSVINQVERWLFMN